MLAIVDSPRASFDPGSVALALLRCFTTEGPEVLFIDANPSGSALATRFGEMAHDDFSPGVRGLPTLIAAGAEHLEPTKVKEHCWRLDNPGGVSPWLMFAPSSQRGAAQSSAWLNDHAEEVAALDERFRLVVASSLKRVGADAPVELLRRADRLVLITSAATAADQSALDDPFADTELPSVEGQQRQLMVEGSPKISDGDLAVISPLEYVGRIPAVGDARLLMPHRRERRQLDRLAAAVDEKREPAPASAGSGATRLTKPVKPSGRSKPAKPAKPGKRAKPVKPSGRSKPTGKANPAADRPPPVKPKRRRGTPPAD